MNVGMLWYDNDPQTALKAKIDRAADYYRRKYGRLPNLCLVNPSMLGDKHGPAGKVSVQANRAILPGHLWIGEEGNS